jgi:putative ABC transport system permease protein
MMLQHYFKTATRMLLKHKVYSLINISGLSIGLACSILILLFVKNELSFDHFHVDKDNIYRVNIIEEQSGEMTSSAITTGAVGPSMIEEFPEVKAMVRLSNPDEGFFTWQNKHFFTSLVSHADSSFFGIFSFKLLSGNPETALAEPNTVVLSRKLAGQIFGERNPVGEFIRFNNKENLFVTGVAENPPVNSTLQFNALISFSSLYNRPDVFLDWDGGWNYITFVKLLENVNLKTFETKFPDFLEKHINYKYKPIGITLYLMIQPLKDLHLRSNLDYDLDNRGNLPMIYIFTAIAIFILIIACINFMNLATARSMKRAKEVGLRKVVGAEKNQIIRQFLGESITTSLIALVGAIILIEIFQPEFNRLVNTELHLFKSENIGFISGILILTLGVGLLAGSYPSFFMASYQPVKIIKGDFNVRSGKPVLRNILVVFQFFISSALILFTLLVFSQMKYISNKNLGYNKENVIYLNLHDPQAREKIEILKAEFRNIPGVISTGASTGMPGYGLTSNGYFPEGYKEPMMIHALDMDFDFLEVMKIPVVEGRNFSKEYATDADAFLINETLAKKLGWDDPIGKKIMRDGEHKVIGVIHDFHFSTLHTKIEPLLITMKPWDGFYHLAIRLSPGNLNSTLTAIEKKWNEILPNQPYSHIFLDSDVENAYAAENNTRETFLYFSLLAILIACLGLFGLANYSGEQKRKEIGIRKVYGASSGNILTLLSSDYTKWVILANILAWPLAYWAMDKWLQLFEYRTSIGAWIFILTFCITSVISIVTVIYQVIHAARANPVDTIKYE